MARPTLPRSWQDGLLVAAALGLWAVLLPEMIPERRADSTIFVSVAERVLAGDRLYVDVWDNKEPLFFYGLAAARWVSPFAGFFAELCWVVLACASMASLARWAALSRRWCWVLSVLVTPLIVLGFGYTPGFTHLPGVSLSVAALALAARGRVLGAGVLLGAVLFVKILVFPVAATVLLGAVLLPRHGRPWSALLALGAGTVVLSAAVLVTLGVRGELTAFVQTFAMNSSYAGGIDGGGLPTPIRHLVRVLGGRQGYGVVLLATVLVLTRTSALSTRPVGPARAGAQPTRTAWWLAVGGSLAALLVLAETGMWPHHAQILQVPALVAALLLPAAADRVTSMLPGGSPGGPRVGGLRRLAAALIVTTYAVSIWAPGYPSVVQPIRQAPMRWERLGGMSAASAILASRPPGSYARVGDNDDDFHAVGLSSWRLGCPRFHQYYFQPKAVLDETLACLPRVDAIIVAPSGMVGSRQAREALDLEPVPVDPRPWFDYLAAVHDLIGTGYRCLDVPTGGLVCLREGALSGGR